MSRFLYAALPLLAVSGGAHSVGWVSEVTASAFCEETVATAAVVRRALTRA